MADCPLVNCRALLIDDKALLKEAGVRLAEDRNFFDR